MPKEEILKALAAVEIEPSVRGEALTIEAFAKLSNAFSQMR
jgi:16S rRNA A1518/A1519 N6-dimethyltransferase RsmA/KsgA/DIM1 with predicted DNA glycosylase/AP lyase activity